MKTRTLAVLGLAAAVTLAVAPAGRADPIPSRIWIVGDGARILRDDVGSAQSKSERDPIWRPGLPVRLAALRDEVVAFQVIVEGGDAGEEGVTVELAPFQPPYESDAGAPAPAEAPTSASFVEHYVEVKTRSRNAARPAESLGWSPAARPPDEGALGWVPDALIPVAIAPAWAPYPLSIAPRQNGAIWIDVAVPHAARAGAWRAELTVRSKTRAIGRMDVELQIADAELPYRPVSFFTYYDPERALPRVGDLVTVERQLWQLLHAHHVDALGTLLGPADVERLRPALDGSLFTPGAGYQGPGEGVPPAVVAIGVYGQLGEPAPAAMRKVDEIAQALPNTSADVFVYAVDEQCDSLRGPAWRKLLRASSHAGRIGAGHTCDRDPREQSVDVAIMPAAAFAQPAAELARAAGKRVWIYNGWLPRTGTMLIDAPYIGLMVDGWIAATRNVGRWFLWESTFWHDSNRGGHGPLDPFTQPESFHNQDGDSCLGEGLLVYPGKQPAPFQARSIGLDGVLPSMRLKMLRRGIQDAGYYALARAAAPAAADAIAAHLIPEALDEVAAGAAPSWPTEGAAYAAARASLRALIPAGARLGGPSAARVLEAAAAERPRLPAVARAGRARWVLYGAAALVVVAVAALALRRMRSRP